MSSFVTDFHFLWLTITLFSPWLSLADKIPNFSSFFQKWYAYSTFLVPYFTYFILNSSDGNNGYLTSPLSVCNFRCGKVHINVVDYRIWRQHVFNWIRHRRLEAVPHWQMGEHIAKHHRRRCWSICLNVIFRLSQTKISGPKTPFSVCTLFWCYLTSLPHPNPCFAFGVPLRSSVVLASRL